jgi:type II secretion system protein L
MRGAGFDIGARVLTLAVVSTGLKGVKVERVLTRRIAKGTDGVVETMRALKREASLGAQPAALAIPAHAVSTRSVTLPFIQRTTLNSVLPAELEGLLPFDLDDVVIDGFPVAQEAGRSHVLAAAVPKATLKALLDDAGRAGLDPRVVTVDAMALAGAAEAWLPPQADLALIHLDERSITLGLLQDRRLRGLRGLSWDGESARRALAEDLDLDVDALDDAVGGGDPRVSGARVMAALALAFQPVLDELRRSLRADAAESGRRIAAIALSGRWSAFREVGAWLADALGLKLVEWPSLPIDGAQRPLAPFALAAGLAVAGGARAGTQLDFRRGEFAYGRERAGVRRRAVAAAIMAAVVLLIGGIDLGVRAAGKETRYREVHDRVRAMFREALPEVTTIVSETDQLRSAIETLAKRRAFLGGEVGALDVLLALTDAIPKESGIAVSELVIDQDKVRIEAETGSFDWVNRIESALAKSPAVRTIAVSDAKTTADQSKVRFLMTITLAEGV